MALEYNIPKESIFFGGATDINFTIYTDNSKTVVKDISGLTLEFVVRENYNSASALITKTTGSGITITNGPAGLCKVQLLDSDSLAFLTQALKEIEDYVYTLRDSGNNVVLAFGKFPIKLVATR